MKDLSIVIKMDEKNIRKKIEILKPLFLNYNTELIIIGNIQEAIDIPFKYSVLNYDEDSIDFETYCIACSTGRKIMVINRGMKLSSELIDLVNRGLKVKDYLNITVNRKYYLSEEHKLFFTWEEILVYNRGITGFNKKIDIALQDYGLIDMKKAELKEIINHMIRKGYFKELIIWYENYIVNMPSDYQQLFYYQIEKTKQILEEKDLIRFDDLFLQSAINNDVYRKYLLYRKQLRSHKIESYKWVTDDSKNLKLTESAKYYCWLIRDFIQDKVIPDFICQWDGELRQGLVQQLIEEDKDAFDYIYEFMVLIQKEVDIAKEKPNVYIAYLSIVKVYMNCLVMQSKDFTESERLLRALYLYMELLKKGKDKISPEEEKLSSQLQTVTDLINNNKINNAIELLEEISNQNIKLYRILYHYIRKIRNKYKHFSYVLSICMIVKNEEKNLDRCLRSIKSLIDLGLAELIIVDTGSSDGTLEIAKTYTNKVFQFEWKGNFSESRNISALFAQGEYVFVLDADEEFNKTELDKLITEFSSNKYKNYNAYTLKITSFIDLEHTRFSAITQKRIFRNNEYAYYENSIHNQLEFQDPVKNLEVEVLHYGYIMTDDIKEKKFLRTATLLHKELQKEPRNIYYRYQLSSSYAMHNDLNEALKQIDIMVRLIKESRKINATTLMYYNNAVSIYLAAHRYNDAEELMNAALTISPDFIDFIYYKLTLLFIKKEYEESIGYINKFLDLIEDYFKLDVANNEVFSFYTVGNKDAVLQLYIHSNYRLKKYNICLEKVYLIGNIYTLKNCIHDIVDCYVFTKQYLELEKFYIDRVKPTNSDIKDLFLYFLWKHIEKSPQEIFISNKYLIENINEMKAQFKEQYPLKLFEQFDMDFMDMESAWDIYQKVIPMLKKDLIMDSNDDLGLYMMKKAVSAILRRSKEFINLNLLKEEELISFLDIYITICIRLITIKQVKHIEAKELLFASKIALVFNKYMGEHEIALQLMEEAVMSYIDMEDIIKIVNKRYFPVSEYNTQNDKGCLIDVSNTFSRFDKNSNSNNIRVLHGSMDITNKTMTIINALKDKGIDVKGLNYFPLYSDKPMDYEMDIGLFDNNQILKNQKEIATRLIEEFDIFHFHYLSTLTLDHSDLSMIKTGNKKMYMHCWGQDVRLYSKAHIFNPYFPDLSDNDDEIKRELELISKYISCCIISDYELYDYVKDYFQDIKYINRMIDMKKYIAGGCNNRKKLSIVHVVTSSDLQGSKEIVETMEKLKTKYDIKFKLVYNLANKNEMRIFKEADIIIDQVLIGSYSQLAIEAMAMEKPVICWITDYLKEKYPKELPIIIANPDNLEEKLVNIIENRDMIREIGIKSREYVRKYHDINNEINKLIEIYKM